nr:MAG TPA: hypothetical protein [Caudoviricetes sp.]
MIKFIKKNKGLLIFYMLLVVITWAVSNDITIQKISASNSSATQLADK